MKDPQVAINRNQRALRLCQTVLRPVWLVCLLGCLSGAAAVQAAPAGQAYTARATQVSDGDTLWVQPLQGGAPRKLRLEGIDAPELCQTGGPAAQAQLRWLVKQGLLQVVVKHQDHYGRGLARIQINGRDLGAVMVRSGHAWSYRWQRSRGPYAKEEDAARQARVGLFAQPAPELPGDFRRRHGSCYAPDDQGVFRLK